MPEIHPDTARKGGWGLLVGGMTGWALAPSLRGAFLWDDDANITGNALVKTGEGLKLLWTTPGAAQQYYPLTHSTFWLDFQIHGLDPLGYRVENLLLHLLSALLLGLAVRRLAAGAGWLAGALFALHPMNVESVAWITERKNVLAAPLLLASFLLLQKMLDACEVEPRGRARGWLAASWGAFVLAMLAKSAVAPAAIVMPLLLLPKARARWRWLLTAGALMCAVAVPIGLITARIEGLHLLQHPEDFGAPLFARLDHAGQSVAFYLSRALVPANLAFFYPTPVLAPPWPPGWVWSLLSAVGVLAAGWWATRGRPWPLLVSLAVLGMLFPALGLVEVYFFRYAPVQNHFAYFAMLPLCGAFAVAVERWCVGRSSPWIKRASVTVGLGVLALVSRQEAARFTSTETLFKASLETYPEPWPAHQSLGLAAMQADRSAEAVSHFRAALHVRPKDAEIWSNLGASLSRLGQHEEAAFALRRATELNPRLEPLWSNLAEGLRAAGQHKEAMLAYREALARAPGNARILRRMAELLLMTQDPGVRDPAEAVRLASEACARTRKTRARCLQLLEAAQRAAGQEAAAEETKRQAERARAEEGEVD